MRVSNREVFLIPSKYVDLLVYDDPSGLTEGDIMRFKHFLENNKAKYLYFKSNCPYEAITNDVDGIPCEVYEVYFNINRYYRSY